MPNYEDFTFFHEEDIDVTLFDVSSNEVRPNSVVRPEDYDDDIEDFLAINVFYRGGTPLPTTPIDAITLAITSPIAGTTKQDVLNIIYGNNNTLVPLGMNIAFRDDDEGIIGDFDANNGFQSGYTYTFRFRVERFYTPLRFDADPSLTLNGTTPVDPPIVEVLPNSLAVRITFDFEIP